MFKEDKQVDEYSKDIKLYSETLINIASGSLTGWYLNKKIVIVNKTFYSYLESKGVSYLTIVEYATQVFTEEGLTKYFGKTYLTILQKSVLVPEKNLTEVTTTAWKRKF